MIEYLDKVIEVQGVERVSWNDHGRVISLMRKSIFGYRERLVKEYSWAIPNREAIEAIKALGKDVVEIGAGSGYWGMLLRATGVKCHLYDLYVRKEVWTFVTCGGVEKVIAHSDCALFLCWPPYSESLAYECVRWYSGDYVIYVGEGYGGCTADDAFHIHMNDCWELIGDVNIPQWWGINDRFEIYRRPKQLTS